MSTHKISLLKKMKKSYVSVFLKNVPNECGIPTLHLIQLKIILSILH